MRQFFSTIVHKNGIWKKYGFQHSHKVVTGVFLALVTTLQQCVNTTDGILIPWKKVALVCYWSALLNKVETTTLAQKVCLSSQKVEPIDKH